MNRMPIRSLCLIVGLFLSIGAGVGCDSTGGPEAHLVINEFMADNETVIPDDFNVYSDWIELYNGGNSSVQVGGLFITDDLKVQTQWQLPGDMELEAEGYLVLWASGNASQGDLHLPFALGAGGEELGLYTTSEDGTPVQIDAVSFGSQEPDEAAARETDGGEIWITTTSPTPGESNG
jgi:hypothetical protein